MMLSFPNLSYTFFEWQSRLANDVHFYSHQGFALHPHKVWNQKAAIAQTHLYVQCFYLQKTFLQPVLRLRCYQLCNRLFLQPAPLCNPSYLFPIKYLLKHMRKIIFYA